ncbi:MAG: hypothetical protein SGARI_005197, partial [Bacillariaceae sp.]
MDPEPFISPSNDRFHFFLGDEDLLLLRFDLALRGLSLGDPEEEEWGDEVNGGDKLFGDRSDSFFVLLLRGVFVSLGDDLEGDLRRGEDFEGDFLGDTMDVEEVCFLCVSPLWSSLSKSFLRSFLLFF